MGKLFYIGFLMFLFCSCQQEKKVVFIQFDNSEGIGENQQVLLNGVSVGTVLDVTITKDFKVIASVHLSDSLDFPDDSIFEIQRKDLFTKAIYMTLGESETFLKKGDTIQGIRSFDVLDQIPGINDPPALFEELKEVLRNN